MKSCPDHPRHDEAMKAINDTLFNIQVSEKAGAFITGCLMSAKFHISTDHETIGVAGTDLIINPDFFLGLNHKAKATALLQKAWSIGLIHEVRKGDREEAYWDQACEIKINGILDGAGLSFDGLDVLRRPDLQGMTEEHIYEVLYRENKDRKDHPGALTSSPSEQPGVVREPGKGDEEGDGNGKDEPGENEIKIPSETRAQLDQVQAASQAKAAAEMGKDPGSIPGSLEEYIESALKVRVEWQDVLAPYLTEIIDKSRSYRRLSRRTEEFIMPGRILNEEGKLTHLMFFFDVSGSVSTEDEELYFANTKFIKDQFNPEKFTLAQFDTKIQKVQEILEDDPFEGLEIIGRGGTDLRCVRKMILERQPKAAVIFSDMYCAPMESVGDIPVIWIVVGNPSATVPFGKAIYVEHI